MAVLPRQAAPGAPSISNATNSTTQVYLTAVILAIFSFVIMLLVVPPMLWHFRNRNIGATVLVAWVILLLLFTSTNAVLWPNDNISNWYNGTGLCDVEVKIQVASQVAFPASLACVLRALAAVMDTDHATLVQTKAQRRRRYAVDLLWCVGFPLLQMLLHYLVQTRRYYLYGIAGCVPAVSTSVVTIFLLVVPPMIWTLVDSHYAALILIRLYRYRLSFSSILAHSNTTKSRFMRLYILCIMWVLGYIPVQAFTLYTNIDVLAKQPFSWSGAHDPEYWDNIVMVPSNGRVLYDRWIWLTSGVIVFVFFGCGRDAVNMYRTGLLAVGFGKVFPSLSPDHRSSGSATMSSFSSKARMLFKLKSSSSDSTRTSASSASRISSPEKFVSPRKMGFLDTVDESSSIDESVASGSKLRFAGGQNHETLRSGKPEQPFLRKLASMFSRKTKPETTITSDLPLSQLTGEPATVQSAVVSGPRSPTLTQHVRAMSSGDVVVIKEVRQGIVHEGA